MIEVAPEFLFHGGFNGIASTSLKDPQSFPLESLISKGKLPNPD
jgi:hypothetical protein